MTSVNNRTGAVLVQENVQSDWSATTGLAKILNKPALKSVAITGSYDDLTDVPVWLEGEDDAEKVLMQTTSIPTADANDESVPSTSWVKYTVQDAMDTIGSITNSEIEEILSS